MSDQLLQKTLEVAIQVMLPVVLGALVVLAKQAWAYIKTQIDARQLEIAGDLARQFVQAAEQNGLVDAALAEGKAKKVYVLNQLDLALQARGIHLDIGLLSDLIEAQVLAQFNWPKIEPQVLPAPGK